MKKVILFLSLPFLFFRCSSKKDALFESLDPEETGVTFSNTLEETDSLHILEFTYFYNGGGVGVGDVNGDGLQDMYFTGNQVSSKLYLNRGHFKFEDVTEAAGVGTRGWARGVSLADVNADGKLDLYVSVAGTTHKSDKANLLFINQGNDASGKPQFRELAREYGLADTAHTTQTAFLDYDRDGDLDAYLLTNAIEPFNPNTSRPKKTNGEGLSTDRLYRNEGKSPAGHPQFKDVSREAGITIEGYGLGIAVSDLNEDGWPDIYCANDFISNDLVWINNRNGTFTNRADQYLKHQSYNGMGTDIADFNNDGLKDIVVLDMLPEDNKRQKMMTGNINFDKFYGDLNLGYQPQYVRNTLQLNNGFRPGGEGDSSQVPFFSEIGYLSGISKTDWSWSALFADFDNDGFRDLFITNGYGKDITDLDYATYHDEQAMFGNREAIRAKQIELAKNLPAIKLHNYLYRNNGDLTFSDQSEEWGMGEPTLSNGAAYADFDNDGDLDVVVNNINQPASLYRNRAADREGKSEAGSANHYLRVTLRGPAGNPEGLGTKINLHYGSKQQVYEQSVVRGFQSTVEAAAHFGLGKVSQVDSVEVIWPDGKYQLLRNVKANQVLTAHYGNAKDNYRPAEPAATPLFTEVAQDYGIDYVHQENDFLDFKYHPLLPQLFSKNGPGLAMGDVNGDGLDDFYVGGASGKAGKLYQQTATADRKPRFTGQLIDPENKREEDLGSLFFDADNDHDLDLYVVSGGSEFAATSPWYQDRLYLNDGKGHFRKDTLALPKMLSSGSVVTAADYDHDGDLDLFVGGRVAPGVYPYVPNSYLLRNDSKPNAAKFTDVTLDAASGLKTVGMVTSALWTDFDQDGWTDLLLAGEWLPLTFYQNQKGKLTDVTAATGLTHTSGWWNGLAGGDFDNDGDIDYVAGNLGLNSKYKASPTEPVCIYAADFDANGTLDPVLCYYLPGALGQERAAYPSHPRDNFKEQMPGIRKMLLKYADYAAAKAEDLFPKEQFEKAFVVRSETMQSAYVENLGGGKFRMKSLPLQAQFAPVFGILCNDYNGDGNLDLLLSGNSYAPEVQTGQYDALPGLLLQGDGKGSFTPVPARKSGFFVNGDTKGLAELVLSDGTPLVLSAANGGRLTAFTFHKNNSVPKSLKTVPLAAFDATAEITFTSKARRRQECYYGSAYLSQSSRTLCLPPDAVSVTITDYAGKKRTVAPRHPLAQ